MNKELIDRAWACLPREFKEKVKKKYARCVEIDEDDNPNLPAYAVKSAISRRGLLEKLFGIHNLTSYAEGEEMLCVKASKVREMYALNEKILYLDSTHKGAILLKKKLTELFGSKCLTDELNEDNFAKSEPKPAAPKFRKDEKVRIKGVAGFDVIKDIYGTGKDGYRYELAHEIAIYDESDLEPYTEPEEKSCTDTCTDDCSSQCKSQDFGTIVKDSFRNERRLNIAAQIVASMVGSDDWTTWRGGSNKEIWHNMAKSSLEIADALIAEAEKGGDNA